MGDTYVLAAADEFRSASNIAVFQVTFLSCAPLWPFHVYVSGNCNSMFFHTTLAVDLYRNRVAPSRKRLLQYLQDRFNEYLIQKRAHWMIHI
jgi:hypothetical protein